MLVLFLLFIATVSYAHREGSIDDNGGHWYHRLGVYHQHYDFDKSIDAIVDGTYDWDKKFYTHENYRMRFYRLGIRTYQFGSGKHAFGFQGARQQGSEFDYGSQWSLGVNYRRRYSKHTTLTYSIDYYRANQFHVIDYGIWWGIYVPRISQKLSLHTGFLTSTMSEAELSMSALSNALEYETGSAIFSVRYDLYYNDMSILSTGVTYKF